MIAKYLESVLRRAFPMLEYYLELGMAVHNVTRATIFRDDVVVAISRGQIRVDHVGERWADMTYSAGTQYVEPTADNWGYALAAIAKVPQQAAGTPIKAASSNVR